MAQKKTTTAQGRAATSRTSAAAKGRSGGAAGGKGTHAAGKASAGKSTAAARSGAARQRSARPQAAPAPATRRVASAPVQAAGPRAGLLDMQAHHDIAGVIVGIVGVALLIAVLTPTTGMLTSAISNGLHALLGVGAVLVPIALIIWGVTFFVNTDRIMPGRAALGLGLVALAVISLLGITTPGAVENPAVLFNTYVLADRGGYVGNGLAWCLLQMTGKPIGIIVLVGVALAGLIVIGFSVTQTVQDLVLRHRERREWARLRSQERSAQRAREQQAAWFDRSGVQIPADYAPTALFDPDRPLSGDVGADGAPASSVIRGSSDAAPARAARSFGCGDAPMGGVPTTVADLTGAPGQTLAGVPGVAQAATQAGGMPGAGMTAATSAGAQAVGTDGPVAPLPARPRSARGAAGRRAPATTFLQSEEVREAYDYPVAGADANSAGDPAVAPAPQATPAPAASRGRRAASLSRSWWDEDDAAQQAELDEELPPTGDARERQLSEAAAGVPVPGVIDGAPRTLADFGLDASDFEEAPAPAEGRQAPAASRPTEGAAPAVIPVHATPIGPAGAEGPASADVRPGRAARAAARVSALTADTLAKDAANQAARTPRRAATTKVSFTDTPEEGLPWEDAPAPKAGGVRVSPSGDAPAADHPFVLPDPSVLKRNTHGIRKTKEEEAEIAQTGAILQQTLNEFGVKADVVDWVYGPTCTTYEVSPGEGVRVNKFTSLEDDIARALATESVRIYAPVPGTSYVGIEVPNRTRQTVCFGDVLPYVDGGPLDFAVGLDANGQAVHVDLAKLPHLLVAGTTGSGKSVMVNSIVMSMLMRTTPDDVRLIMVDPKQVEFKDYDGIPHLIMPVVTDMRQAAAALQWGVTEMDRRYRVFSNVGVRDLAGYNALVDRGAFAEQEFPLKHLPSIVMVVDELADLMMVAKKDVEASIVRIAQLGRAAGVHLVLATQSPRADVVTGLIRANVACRAGLKVAKSTDSKIAIDQTGAEKLLGHGDMLFLQTAWGDKPRRIQGCYLSDSEIAAVVEHLKGQAAPDYDTGMAPLGTVNGQLTMSLDASGAGAGSGGEASLNDDDPLAWRAAQLVVEHQLGSTSMIQRQLKLGYARAGRVMDMLEEMGVVGPAKGSKPRDVLIRDLDELATIRGTQSFEEEY